MRNATSRAAVRLVISMGCGGLLACGPPPERAMQSHRLGVDAWQTVGISEDGRELHVRVVTGAAEDTAALAARIVEQRRAQGWQAIRVTIQEQGQGAERTVVARHPYRPGDVTEQ